MPDRGICPLRPSESHKISVRRLKMTVQDERLVLVISIDYVVFSTVVGVAIFISRATAFYLPIAEHQTLGRLM
jgi:hypothetical protein